MFSTGCSGSVIGIICTKPKDLMFWRQKNTVAVPILFSAPDQTIDEKNTYHSKQARYHGWYPKKIP